MKVKPANLVSVNEKEELRAQKAFYDKIEAEMEKKGTQQLDLCRKLSLVYKQTIALMFVAVYWIAGLRHANVI